LCVSEFRCGRERQRRGPVCRREHSIYDQEAFGYLLAVEQQRSARSASSFHLLLVSSRDARPDGPAAFAPATAARIVGALSASVRDSDFIGWYRESGTIGAVLTHHRRGASPDHAMRVFDRVVDSMLAALPEDIVKAINVQLVEVSAGHYVS